MPIAITILASLTFSALIPPLTQYFVREPLEVSFRYPGPNRPALDSPTYYALSASLIGAQGLIFIFCIVTGIGILKAQRWAWRFGIGAHTALIVVIVLSVVFIANLSNGQYATMIISIVSLYLLSRKDVRNYLRV